MDRTYYYAFVYSKPSICGWIMGDFWLPPVHTVFSSTYMFLLDVLEALLVGIKTLYYTRCVGVALVMQQSIYAYGTFSLSL